MNMGSQGLLSPPPGSALFSNVAYIPPGLEGAYKDPFTYNVIFTASTAASVQTAVANVQNDAYFVCVEQTASIFDSATGLVNTAPNVAPMLVRIQDTSSGKFKMDVPTPIGALFGTSIAPFVWLYRAPIYMPGGQIQVELTNNMAATQVVRFQFTGFKVYKVPDELVQL
jgi:hypothetical protein